MFCLVVQVALTNFQFLYISIIELAPGTDSAYASRWRCDILSNASRISAYSSSVVGVSYLLEKLLSATNIFCSSRVILSKLGNPAPPLFIKSTHCRGDSPLLPMLNIIPPPLMRRPLDLERLFLVLERLFFDLERLFLDLERLFLNLE